jgi:hypothetical protein
VQQYAQQKELRALRIRRQISVKTEGAGIRHETKIIKKVSKLRSDACRNFYKHINYLNFTA